MTKVILADNSELIMRAKELFREYASAFTLPSANPYCPQPSPERYYLPTSIGIEKRNSFVILCLLHKQKGRGSKPLPF